MKTPFERILVYGYPYLKGQVSFSPETLFGIHPNDRICSIGRPKETSANRYDEFNPFATYAGSIKIHDDLFMAFQIPEKDVTGWDLFNPVQPVYKLYVVIEDQELICPNYDDLTIRIHKPIFKHYHE